MEINKTKIIRVIIEDFGYVFGVLKGVFNKS